jgi:sugar O-acyltransferase (sialic acid O-acetyltransferase NeuD family)
VQEFKKIHILGYSGHAYVVIDTALSNNFMVKSYFDKTKAKLNPYKLIYNGFEKEVPIKSIIQSDFVFPAIGSNIIRKNLINFIEREGLNQTQLINLSASVSQLAKIGCSTFVAPQVTINSLSSIGKGCIINSGAIIEHECKIGDFSHIAPCAVIAGNVTIGNQVFIGANAVIKQNLKIGDNAVIGAGAVVLKDVPPKEIWVGNPARKIR